MRRGIIVVFSVVVVLVLIVLLAPVFLNANQFRPEIESKLSDSLGRKVSIGDLSLSIFSGKITARDLSIADDPAFNPNPFLTAKSIALSVGLFDAVFHHTLNVSAVDIDSPAVVLTQAPSGLWNFSTLGANTTHVRPVNDSTNSTMAVMVKSLRIDNARVSISQGAKPQVLDGVNVDVKNFSPAASFPFTISGKVEGGGDVSITGNAGPINSSNAASTPLTANVVLNKLNLAASGAVPPSSGIDGQLSINAAATSDGRAFHLNGKLTGENLKLAPGATAARNPLMFDVDATNDLIHRTGQMTQGDVAIGGVKAKLTGTWAQQGQDTVLKMLLAAPGLPVAGVEGLLPALAIFLPAGASLNGGTASANMTIAGPTQAIVISGPVSVQNTQLKRFDLGSKLVPIEKLAGVKSGPNTEIQTLSTNLRIAQDGTALQDIHAVLPSIGELTGSGTISKSQTLAFRMRALVHGGGLISTTGSASIPFTIEGTSANPQFRPDLGQLASEQLNQRLQGLKVGNSSVGQTAGGLLQGILGGKKK